MMRRWSVIAITLTAAVVTLAGCGADHSSPRNDAGILLPVELPATPGPASQPGDVIEPGQIGTMVNGESTFELVVLGAMSIEESNGMDFVFIGQFRESGEPQQTVTYRYLDRDGNEVVPVSGSCPESVMAIIPAAPYAGQAVGCNGFHTAGQGVPVEYEYLGSEGGPFSVNPVVFKLS